MISHDRQAEAVVTGSLDHAEASELAALFKPLSDPSRVALFSALAVSEVCVHELAEQFGMEQSAVSHQLRVLRDQNLVITRREGRHIYYRLADSHVRAIFDLALEHLRHTNTDTVETVSVEALGEADYPAAATNTGNWK